MHEIEPSVSVAKAAKVLDESTDTIRLWCTRYGFGWKPTPTAQWRMPVSKLRPPTDTRRAV
jgi:hypothetical protein